MCPASISEELGGRVCEVRRPPVAICGFQAQGICVRSMSGDLSSQAGGGPGSRQEVGCQQAREGRSALIWVRRGGLRAEEGANVCLALGPGGTAGLARYRDGNWFGGLWDPNSEDSRWPPIVTASSRYPRRSTHPPVADADAKVIVP